MTTMAEYLPPDWFTKTIANPIVRALGFATTLTVRGRKVARRLAGADKCGSCRARVSRAHQRAADERGVDV